MVEAGREEGPLAEGLMELCSHPFFLQGEVERSLGGYGHGLDCGKLSGLSGAGLKLDLQGQKSSYSHLQLRPLWLYICGIHKQRTSACINGNFLECGIFISVPIDSASVLVRRFSTQYELDKYLMSEWKEKGRKDGREKGKPCQKSENM